MRYLLILLLCGVASAETISLTGASGDFISFSPMAEWHQECPICKRDMIQRTVSCPGGILGCCVLHYDYQCPYCIIWLSDYYREQEQIKEQAELKFYREKYKDEYRKGEQGDE